jgi:hypothetical protein
MMQPVDRKHRFILQGVSGGIINILECGNKKNTE